MNLQQLLRLRRLATVPRWVTIPTLRSQSVAEHSFHVAVITRHLASIHPAMVAEAAWLANSLWAALVHDESEAVMGDIPAPVKLLIDGGGVEILEDTLGVKKIQGVPAQIVKVADVVEAICFLDEEYAMGNFGVERVRASLMPIFYRAWDEMTKDWVMPVTADEFMTQMKAAYNPNKHPPLDHI